MAMTATEKMLARASGNTVVMPSEVVVIEPDVILSHDNTAAIAQIFNQLPHRRIRYPGASGDHAGPCRAPAQPETCPESPGGSAFRS